MNSTNESIFTASIPWHNYTHTRLIVRGIETAQTVRELWTLSILSGMLLSWPAEITGISLDMREIPGYWASKRGRLSSLYWTWEANMTKKHNTINRCQKALVSMPVSVWRNDWSVEVITVKTVSTIKNTKAIDISALNKFLMTKGMRIANGYGDLKDKTFRIAHMGEIRMQDIEKLLKAMEEFLKK